MKTLIFKQQPFFTVLATLLFVITSLTSHLLADTVKTLDGKSFEGSILSVTDSAIVMEVRQSSTITYEKTFQRDDVKSFSKEKPDVVAYNKLKEIMNTPPLLNEAGYDRRISQIDQFSVDYPGSKMSLDVAKMAAKLKTEKERVVSGWIKIGGADDAWVTPEQYQKDAYNYDAIILHQRMLNKWREGEYLEALRHFDTIETKYDLASVYPESISKAKTILKSFARKLDEKVIPEQSVLVDQWEAGIKRQAPEQQEIARNAFSSEREQFAHQRKTQLENKIKWAVYDPFEGKSIQATRKLITVESERIASISPNSIKEASDVLKKVAQQVSVGNAHAANDIIAGLNDDFKNNLYAKKLQAQIDDLLEKQDADEKEAMEQEQHKKANTITNIPKPGMEVNENGDLAINDPIREKLGNLHKPEPKETAAPKNAAREAVNPAEKDPVAVATEKKTTPPAPTPQAAAPPEKKIGFQQIMMIVAGLLVVTIIVAKVTGIGGGGGGKAPKEEG